MNGQEQHHQEFLGKFRGMINQTSAPDPSARIASAGGRKNTLESKEPSRAVVFGVVGSQALNDLELAEVHSTIVSNVPPWNEASPVLASTQQQSNDPSTTSKTEIQETARKRPASKLRSLSPREQKNIDDLVNDPYMQKLERIPIFSGQLDLLKEWPSYFRTSELAGTAMQNGFVTLWTTIIVMESLLATIAVQPFVAGAPYLKGWQLEIYGALWMLSLLSDVLGLAATAIFLGFLLASPSRFAWIWMCELGPLIAVPSILVLLDTFMSLIAVGFSSWAIYGLKVGISCVVVEVIIVSGCILISIRLKKAVIATLIK